MKHTLQQIFHSGKFLFGFVIFVVLMLIATIYPLIIKTPSIENHRPGHVFPPGVYVNTYDSINASTKYILNLDDAAAKARSQTS